MKNNPLILTFDVGTQSTRCMIVDKKGEILDIIQKQYEKPYYSTKDDYAEQKPDFYFNKMCEASVKLRERNPKLYENIIGVTLTCIRDTVLCLDKDNKPLRDIILWLDKREANPADLPKIPVIKNFLFKLAGVQDTIEMQQRQSACNWLMTKEKDIWDKTNKYVMLPTYLNYLLTGTLKDSTSNQIGHFPYDYKNGKWMNKNGLTRCLFDVPNEKLVELCEPGDVIGYISEECSKLTGIKKGLPLIATGSDKGCETLGLSVTTKNKAAISFGTTATIQFTTEKYFEPLNTAPSYPASIKGLYNPEVQIYRGYWMISWYKKEFCTNEELEAKKLGVSTEEILNKMLPTVERGSNGLILQPFWSPGVTNPNARGTMIGFRDIHGKAHIYRAIIEGIGYGLMDGLYSMEKRGKQKIDEIYVGGGGSQSDEICQITANMFGLPIKRIQTHEASGLGSSMIGFISLGVYKDLDEASKNMIRDKDVFTPNMEEHKYYSDIYHNVYRKIYPKMDPLFKKLKKVEKNYE